MTRFPLCRRGHKLKTGKDGRQRCPICQSKYLREWRAKQAIERLLAYQQVSKAEQTAPGNGKK